MTPTSIDAHRRESPRPSEFDGEEVRYTGRAFPKVGEFRYLDPVEITGAFHVERWLCDSLGEFGVVLAAAGKSWAVFDIDGLEWIS